MNYSNLTFSQLACIGKEASSWIGYLDWNKVTHTWASMEFI